MASLILSMYAISHKTAYAEGTVPPSAVDAYPGLDPRLVGVPIEKTDTSQALVAYSEAVAHVSDLDKEKSTLQSNITVLGPENVRAKDSAKVRTHEYNEITSALNALIIAQYENVARDISDDNQTSSALRAKHQSIVATKSLRDAQAKAKLRKDAADKYAKDVEDALAHAGSRNTDIDKEMVTAKERAKDQRNVVRSGIPIAVIQGLDIPVLTMDAYLRAEKTMATQDPACGLSWWALAGIGRAESNHARIHGSLLDSTGTAIPPIIGVPLNGNGFASIGDSDKGELDGDPIWDHAVGVMQFIPGTWRGYGKDGNGDGKIDPQNVYDAALAAANLLCANASPSMATPEGRQTAYMRYNASTSYVNFVEAKAKEYELLGAGRFNPAPVDATAPAQ